MNAGRWCAPIEGPYTEPSGRRCSTPEITDAAKGEKRRQRGSASRPITRWDLVSACTQTDDPSVTPETPLSALDWIAPQRVRQLNRCGIVTLHDLLTHFPRRHEDRSQFDRFPGSDTDNAVCLCGVVARTSVRRVQGGRKMFDAILEEANAHALSTRITLRWFNAHWVERAIATGHKLVVYGKAKRSGSQLVMAHPELEVVEEEAGPSIHLQRITPVHRATEGLSARVMRQLIWEALAHIPDLPNLLPESLDSTQRTHALRQIHFPDSWEELARARRHLVLEEFFGIQLRVVAKRNREQMAAGIAHCGPGALMERLHQSLPFPLTNAQQRTIGEIRADLATPHPMNRLLHGDVGSGKTLVALSAMLLAVEAGYQAVLMAPTQILAEQHYLQFQRLLRPLGIGVALRTGNRREESLAMPLFDGVQATGDAQVYVGTHALLFDDGGDLNRVGLVVIDEQHKFGVLQRARLREQGAMPDVLVMTATPIPRTLTMTLYGDLEVSVLDELPANRGKIITAARDSSKLPDAAAFMRQQLEQGRQAYVVYPLIDESEKLEVKAATTEFEKWRTLLAPFTCELLHGRVAPEEKDAIMERFRRAETKVLVATTVIEVGIDVPNANLMLIENAERFGLAQLHQLRGRIGRGIHKSYCVLLSSAKADSTGLEKLRILSETTNGFEIAEADLRLRGPGDLLGTAQSGTAPLKIGDLLGDAELMLLARERAFALLREDPSLQQPAHNALRALLAAETKLTLAGVS